ncbi:hypothetical protein F5Y02DRAFT_418032 [Annulohypoxylon stygium]|nr:hypothetical protein F5Y02DRAFT_418032 [Annulohypoxylon stygium]
MPSSNETQSSTSSMNNTHLTSNQSYALQEYLRSDATETERCAGLVDLGHASGGASSCLGSVKDRIKDFDSIFAKNDKDGK